MSNTHTAIAPGLKEKTNDNSSTNRRIAWRPQCSSARVGFLAQRCFSAENRVACKTSSTICITIGASAPALRRAQMYNPDWYYTQPPEPSSQDDYEQEIAKAEQKWELEREDYDD